MTEQIMYGAEKLHVLFERSADKFPENMALVCDHHRLSYRELDEKANQLANFLLKKGYGSQDVLAILLERSLDCYIAILAILKIGATYVPIDVDYPDERINYIFSDLPFRAVVTSPNHAHRSGIEYPETLILSELARHVQEASTTRPESTSSKPHSENVCYIIYTSGSTGRPKGVEITHKNICHYVNVASDVYGIRKEDRVYQGFSLAFDASMEELWMAFANGATLVACTDKDTRSGVGLTEFLQKHEITVFSTVPTLLSTLEGSVSSLRLLILGGETCTANLVNRWARDGLRIFNTYGPTEATVVTTFLECHPDKPVSIGKPLPGYEVLILDENLQEVSTGVAGELCIGGPALARGYVNRPDITAIKFITNPRDNTSRLYRTGDLAYISDNGDIQFAGRIDDQIKLRGFRIELNEIENVIKEDKSISQAVVSLQTLDQPVLVAYLVLDKNKVFDLTRFKAFLKSKLPDYMMPALFEILEEFPLLSSGKIDRKALPYPTQTNEAREYVAPATDLEKQLKNIWEESLEQTHISVTADFFYDLGGHSLLAAKLISRLRRLPEFQTVSILDLYQNPCIRKFAEKMGHAQQAQPAEPMTHDATRPVFNKLKYYLCGTAQFFGCLLQYGISSWPLLLLVLCYSTFTEKAGFLAVDSIALYSALFLLMPVVMATITISAKWLLLGRVKPGKYPLWGWFYFRWWLVQRLQQNVFNTKMLLGTPLIILYNRLLGAKIGKKCFIATPYLAMADMISIGDNSSVAQDARLLGYIVEDGWLKIGPISIGDNCYIGARSTININSILEDNAVVDDMSMLPGITVPKGQFYTGTPARKAQIPADHITLVTPAFSEPGLLQTINYGFLHYFATVFVSMLYFTSFLPGFFVIKYFYDKGDYVSTVFLVTPLAALMFFVIHLSVICIVKRLVLFKAKKGLYPVYSLYYLRQWTVLKMLDIDEIGVMADSLYFPRVLKLLGAKTGKNVEMGEAPFIIPDFLDIESGGFTASGVAIAWPCVFGGAIRYGDVKIREKAFVGNASLLPAGTSMGAGSLLGCMSIPPQGKLAGKEGSAWLGSPPMYLPAREIIGGFPDELTFNPPKRLVLLRLLIELVRILLPTTCTLMLLCNLYYVLDYMLLHTSILNTALILPLADFVVNMVMIAALIGLKWGLLGRVKACIRPLWDVFIWKNDIREFSFGYYINPHLTDLVMGTPFVAWLYRAMGAKIGKRTWIESEGFAEFDLIHIGNDVCINRDSLIQTHLYEDRIFKLDNLYIKDGCNVGVSSMVLYNTVMEPNSTLGSFSLLMKGESLPAGTRWEGSPAQSSTANATSPVIVLEGYDKAPADVIVE